MDQYAQFVPLEIHAVIAQPESMENAAAILELAKLVQFGPQDLLGQTAKITQDLQLQLLGHPGQFPGAHRCEDDLEHRMRIECPGSSVKIVWPHGRRPWNA